MTYMKATEEFKATHPPDKTEEEHHDGYIRRIKGSEFTFFYPNRSKNI